MSVISAEDRNPARVGRKKLIFHCAEFERVFLEQAIGRSLFLSVLRIYVNYFVLFRLRALI
jgi:hypothetical protein